jgi:hypothetical protein
MRGGKAVGSSARLCSLLVLLSLPGFEALAALGAAPTVPVGQSSTMKHALAASASVRRLYAQQERVLGNGTTVREYFGANGLVFAVSWEGPVLPDLDELLGGYFAIFMDGVKQDRQSGRRGSPIHLSRDGLVVQSNGRMRNFFGHAFAPALVPVGVEITDVLQ